MAKRRSDRPRGRVPGIPVPSSERFARSNRTKGWKHGGRSKTVTLLEGRISRLVKLHPDAPQIFADITEAMMGGDPAPLDTMTASALAETEILRRHAVDQIKDAGLTIRDAMVNPEGQEIGSRLKAHPLLEPLRHMNDALGVSADAMLLSRKSRGEGERDAALVKMLERDAMLRAYPKELCPPPAEEEPIEAGVVPGPSDDRTEP